MRWIILSLFLCAFSPIYSQHDTKEKVDNEFKNGYDQMQPRQFTVVTSTPNLSDFRDGEMVIFSSGAVKVMVRVGQEIYTVGISCITVRR